MEPWEIEARAAIGHLVASYNAFGDRGRFDDVVDLFAADATMDIGDGRFYTGPGEILEIFTATRDSVADGPGPAYIQHHTSTVSITVDGPDAASGHAYFTVFMDHGVDHWGRYQDTYTRVDGRWRFASRRVRTDGCTPGGWADRRLNP